ncbi:MAG: hypothetical protein SFW36_19070 [Leptolyngbyaceae cyanobacterium bins.59]|nr:hypothetical protein [Leptolyngbyaceae cyanobacterium bins.59]
MMPRLPDRTRLFDNRDRRGLWFERSMALLVLANLALVLFDATYISWRDFYFRNLPSLTKVYDPIKGIEPERDTQRLLKTVNDLEQQVTRTGLDSPQTELILRRLRLYSRRMIEEDPFQVANKSGSLAKIKNRIKDQVEDESSTQAFTTFWSKEYLLRKGWEPEIKFFNREISPLLAANYYRPIGESGGPVDNFWIIDLPFILLFGLEFLARTYYLSRRRKGVSWLDGMIWRWYDIFLLLPFWRILRVLPAILRLHQSGLLNLGRVRDQFNQSLAANLAGELSEIIVVQTIDQMQAAIKQGDLLNFLFRHQTRRSYVDLNNVNEIEAISQHLVNLVIYQVLPQVQPQLEALIRHGLESGLKQVPLYQDLQKVPGIGQFPSQMIERIVNEATRTAYQTLTASLEDEVGADLTRQLIQQFSTTLETQLRDSDNIAIVQTLLSDLLEEVKQTYVQRIPTGSLQNILDEARELRMLGPK